MDGQRVTARECENVRLYQALQKGGGVCQRSSNPQTSSLRSYGTKVTDVETVRATSESSNKPEQDLNKVVVSNSPKLIESANDAQNFCGTSDSKEPANVSEWIEVSSSASADFSEAATRDASDEVKGNFSGAQVSLNIIKQADTSIGRSEGITTDVSVENTKGVPSTQMSADFSEQVDASEAITKDVLNEADELSSSIPSEHVDDNTSLEYKVKQESMASQVEQGVSFIEHSKGRTSRDADDCLNTHTSTTISCTSNDVSELIISEFAQAPTDNPTEFSLESTDKQESIPPRKATESSMTADEEQSVEEARQPGASNTSGNADSLFEGDSQHIESASSRSKETGEIHDEMFNQYTIQTTVQVVLLDATAATSTIEPSENQPFITAGEHSIEQIQQHEAPRSPGIESQNFGSVLSKSKVTDVVYGKISKFEETSDVAGDHAKQDTVLEVLECGSDSPNVDDIASTVEA